MFRIAARYKWLFFAVLSDPSDSINRSRCLAERTSRRNLLRLRFRGMAPGILKVAADVRHAKRPKPFRPACARDRLWRAGSPVGSAQAGHEVEPGLSWRLELNGLASRTAAAVRSDGRLPGRAVPASVATSSGRWLIVRFGRWDLRQSRSRLLLARSLAGRQPECNAGRYHHLMLGRIRVAPGASDSVRAGAMSSVFGTLFDGAQNSSIHRLHEAQRSGHITSF